MQVLLVCLCGGFYLVNVVCLSVFGRYNSMLYQVSYEVHSSDIRSTAMQRSRAERGEVSEVGAFDELISIGSWIPLSAALLLYFGRVRSIDDECLL